MSARRRVPVNAVLAMIVAGAGAGAGIGCAQSTGDGSPGAATTAASAAREGTVATDFVGHDLDGKTLRLSDYLRRDVVLIDFWATYCEPCLAEMPFLQRMYDQRRTKGFVVVGVAMDGPDTVADVPSFAKRNGLTFPMALDEDSQIASIYNPKKSAPLAVLIDRAGRVVRVHEGYNPGDEDVLARDVDAALGASP